MSATDRPLTVAQMLESDGPGGAELVLFHLAAELAARGHRIVPVGPQSGVGWLGGKLRAAGFEPETFVEGRPPDLRLVRDLAGKLRRRGVDVIHAHEFSMAVYGAAAARLLHRPHVVTLHGHSTMTRAWRRRVALRWAFRRSAAVVAVSRDTKRQLDRDLRISSDVVRVIHNGIPVRPGEPERVRRELGARPGEILILAVGNLDRRKGHIHLLRALARLERCGAGAPWRLAIAGGRGGEERPRLEAFAAEHGLADRVHLLSHRDDVPDLQAAADLFAMPSLWEGLPLALLEAMLAGNPIVASDVSGIPEAIETGVHGLLVPPGDGEALADALGSLLRDVDARKRLGEAARERALREFTVAAMADAYEALYRDSLAAVPGASRPSRSSPR